MRMPTTLIPVERGTRRLPKVSWWYSSILALALIALGITVAAQRSAPPPAASNELAMTASTPTPARAAAPTPAVTPAAASPTAVQVAAKSIEGTVTDAAGKPVQGARVLAGKQVTITGKDGLFSFKGDTVAGVTAVDVFASGYNEARVTVAGTAPLAVSLKREPIKAVYLNPTITKTQSDIDRLVKMIDETELNAVVIDIKEEAVYYDTNVELFKKSGTVMPILDLPKLLKQMKAHHIYTIARLVVFKDSVLAENRKDLAILDTNTGDVWRDMNGVAWVNPADHALWEANSDLAVEAIQRGFDEVQYDYVRFPTDGDLSTMDLGMPYDEAYRVKAITGFLKMTDDKLWPIGGKLSADVFGYTVLTDDDIGIGQNFAELAPYLDYLSPMVYPSHFATNNLGLNGEPNDYPYETVQITMTAGKAKVGGNALKIRPWLQDFSFFNMAPYGDKQVRAQIDAANEVGTSGWMLWDPNNAYHPGALNPAEQGHESPVGLASELVASMPRETRGSGIR